MTANRPWEAFYNEEQKAFNADDVPYTNMAEIAEDTARKYGTKAALTTILPNGAEGSLTYNDINTLSDDMATYLREVVGVKQGDVVAVQSPNCLGYPIALFGVLKAGCICTNINPLYTEPEIEHQLIDSSATTLIVIDLFGDKVDNVVPKTGVKNVMTMSVVDFFPTFKRLLIGAVLKYVKKQIPVMSTAHVTMADALAKGRSLRTGRGITVADYRKGVKRDDTAIYQYTGGTTGRSKGAELTHDNILVNAFQIRASASEYLEEGKEVTLIVLPLYHIFAFTVCVMNGMLGGGHGLLIPNPRPLINVKPAFDNHLITFIPGVNTLFAGLLHESWFGKSVIPNLKSCLSGGTALQEGVANRFLEHTGVRVNEGYGLTESSCGISSTPNSRPKLNHIGIPMPGIDIKIIDDQGNEVAQGEPGELIAKGRNIMKGYLNQSEANAETLKDGWLHTGDVAVMDEDGYLRIVDRMKDMIIVSGFNVYPNELEDVISQVPGVAEVAVIGIPDEKSSEAPKAFVVRSDPNLTDQAIFEACRSNLTGYKQPRMIEFIDELPKSPVGKVLRKELRTLT